MPYDGSSRTSTVEYVFSSVTWCDSRSHGKLGAAELALVRRSRVVDERWGTGELVY